MSYNVIKIFKGADHATVAKLARSSKTLGQSIALLGISSVIMTIMTASAYNRVWKLEDRVDILKARTDVIEADVKTLKKIKTFNNSDEHYKDSFNKSK